ncbi:Activator of Hsp90 ATPase 1 family protein [Chthoniobacter flavus Ellin428]|uniref:Activator of Hsp90 ATPase 1 family protein n=1 Tax=Chthoniobacter flavus Ellin428 TaxID=497964 RepID=B4DC03_9BACT|nr:SRPBCC family protein [Chthoniobacter flavus]EDY16050.1 Activator of Hsp90 ATPase 1 family protein [Chthoniobacter flavus Ellin428]TCO87731.1 uncharacterized protein YndB with AHSA1/START domain [Chthoniobacter flavus]
MSTSPKFVYVTLIATTPEKLWKALTDADFTIQYFFGTRLESDWKVGSPFVFRCADRITDEGTILRSEPPRLLSYTFHHVVDEEMRKESPSRVTFEIESLADGSDLSGPVVRLTVTHEDFPPESKVFPAISKGWPSILSGLKTLLETGKPLDVQKKR